MMEPETGRTKSHSLDSSLWKRVRIWHKTDYTMMMMMTTYLFVHVINTAHASTQYTLQAY